MLLTMRIGRQAFSLCFAEFDEPGTLIDAG